MDESQHAARIAKHLGTSHHQFLIKGETVLSEFTDILARAPEPLGDDSFIPTFVISRETRRHVTVALSGDGGDELFAGYSKYQQFVSARKLRAFSPVCALLARLPWPDKTKKRFDALASGDPSELARWLSTLWKKRELNTLLNNSCRTGKAPDFFSSAWNRRSALDEIERFMLLDMETYLAGDILAKVDRASMAVGLEVRCPFLDQELFDCVFRWRMQSGSKVDGKKIQKRLLARYVPPELFERPKQGFGLPIEDWYRGPLREVLLEYTRPERIRQRGLLNEKSLGDYVAAHLSGRRNFARKLHAIVAFEVWADTFFGTNAAVN
jgi:asparagine synthase (glutamine-hydrolysing)